jgi:hypothetical protein
MTTGAAPDESRSADTPPAGPAPERTAGQIAAASARATRLRDRGLLGVALGALLLLAQRRRRRRAAQAGPAAAPIDRWIALIPGLAALLQPWIGARAKTLLTVLAGARAALPKRAPRPDSPATPT